MTSGLLAETVSLDGGALFIALLVVFIALAILVTLVVFGFVLASKAGRGSRQALGWWIVVLVIEGLLSLQALAAAATGNAPPLVLVVPAIVAAQVALFFLARPRVE